MLKEESNILRCKRDQNVSRDLAFFGKQKKLRILSGCETINVSALVPLEMGHS